MVHKQSKMLGRVGWLMLMGTYFHVLDVVTLLNRFSDSFFSSQQSFMNFDEISLRLLTPSIIFTNQVPTLECFGSI
jgi:hypothetical protein